MRDFIDVRDVARAVVLALERSGADYMPVNVASGKAISILRLAEMLSQLYGAGIKPYVSSEFRKGDIRHCYADVTRAKELLGFEAEIDLKDGLAVLVEWGKAHGWGAVDLFEKALQELKDKQLT